MGERRFSPLPPGRHYGSTPFSTAIAVGRGGSNPCGVASKAEAEFHIIKAIDLCPGNVVNREYLFDYYVYKNEPNKAFLVASEGLKLNANELPLIRDLINSAILLNKVELLDPYIFGTSRSTEQKQQLKKVLREETSSLKGFVTGTIYSALITRIGKLESIIQSDSTTMPETAR